MGEKLRLKFAKTGRAVYISHLDLIRTMQRVFARAQVPVRYSEGFNPHAKTSILLPLSVGCASVCEYMDFSLTQEYPLQTLPERLSACMPEGLRALQVYPALCPGTDLRWLRLQGIMKGCGENAAFYETFFRQDTIPVTRHGKRGLRQDNIAPAIREARFRPGPEGLEAEFLLHAQNPSVSPELMMAALGPQAPAYSRFTRLEAYQEDMTPFR